jgi:hypothetical protein
MNDVSSRSKQKQPPEADGRERGLNVWMNTRFLKLDNKYTQQKYRASLRLNNPLQ